MQSSTVFVCRAFVVLTCLVLVPLAALFGTPLADLVVQALGAHSLTPPAGGPGSLPLAGAAIDHAPPFQGNTVLGATPPADVQQSSGEGLASQAAAMSTAPAVAQASSPDALLAMGVVSPSPTDTSAGGQIASPRSQQTWPPADAPHAAITSWPAQPAFTGQPLAAEVPAAYQVPSDVAGSGPIVAGRELGQAASQLPRAATLDAMPPHGSVAQHVVPAGFSAPTYPTTGFPERAPNASYPAPHEATQPNLVANAPAGGMQGPISPASGASASDRFAQIQERLRALGATYYLLETWGHDGTLFRFHCKMAVAQDPNYTRQFEATDTDALRAMEWVLDQVVRWREGS